jgi:hypothetical protein
MADKTISKRGFVTIATGNPKYYQLAVNLLRSYRLYSRNDPAPFSLICDRDCPEAREFDSFILIQDATCSYMDKLYLYEYTPYEETIFIDADALILNDTQILWDDFSSKPPFSCYGRQLSLDSRSGWFFYEDMGDLKPRLSYNISLHGGLYYLCKNDACKELFETARYLAAHYYEYKFALFKHPADEPVLALAMALANIKPKPYPVQSRIVFLPSLKKEPCINRHGVLMYENSVFDAAVLHFSSGKCSRFLYQRLVADISYKRNGGIGNLPLQKRLKLRIRYLPKESVEAVMRIIKNTFPSTFVESLKELKKAFRRLRL